MLPEAFEHFNNFIAYVLEEMACKGTRKGKPCAWMAHTFLVLYIDHPLNERGLEGSGFTGKLLSIQVVTLAAKFAAGFQCLD